MKVLLLPVLLALVGALPRAADDVRIGLRISDGRTAGPLARIRVRNLGTNAQAGVAVKVFAESEAGLELFSTTVDLPAGGTADIAERVWLDADTTTLVATATLSPDIDEDPTDNAARVALGRMGRRGPAVVGRSIHLAHCASCHGDDAVGGTGPAIVGATAKAILERAAEGGEHPFPWLSRADGRNLGRFLLDPAGVVLPPPLPAPPPGGWPTYAGELKPLLDDRCIRCHEVGRANGGVRLDDYDAVSRNARRALFAVKTGSMPNGGKRFTPAEVAVIQDWIDGGRRP